MTQKFTDNRENIIMAAERLFEANGFHATGVEKLAAEAKVTKRTLYKHFGSKEGLIEAVLQRHHSRLMDRMRACTAKINASGEERLLACFDLYQAWFADPHFTGCLFIKTLNEFQECSKRLFAIAAQAKTELRDYLVELAREANVQNPDLLADQLQLILEGSIIVAQCGYTNDSAYTAREVAKKLISEALRH